MAKKGKSLSHHTIAAELFNDISKLIEHARGTIAITVNRELSMLYWSIGRTICIKVLEGGRASYGDQIVSTLSKQLARRYGRGFTRSALSKMMNFYKLFAEEQIVATLWQQLSWSHFTELITIDDPIKREFYLELTCKEKWSVRTLRDRMDSMLFERTSISKQPEELIRKELKVLKSDGVISHDLIFRDPYVLDFLGLQDTYSEQDMESAIIQQLQRFIIELGTDFAFLSRQKRITIDNEDFKIDLLFYHRGLRRLVAIDLKLGKFKAAYKGQMELYLRWLDKYERRDGEDSPLGLILCSEKKQEQIELLELDKGHIRVAEYLTQLPSKELLAEKLQTAIKVARNKIATTTSPLHNSDKTPA